MKGPKTWFTSTFIHSYADYGSVAFLSSVCGLKGFFFRLLDDNVSHFTHCLNINIEWLRVSELVSLSSVECKYNSSNHKLHNDRGNFQTYIHLIETAKFVLHGWILPITCTVRKKQCNQNTVSDKNSWLYFMVEDSKVLKYKLYALK